MFKRNYTKIIKYVNLEIIYYLCLKLDFMKGKNRKKKIVLIFVSICFSVILLFFTFFFSLSGYLSTTKKVNANILIVEGWLPPYAIEMASDEFKKNDYDLIATTGIQTSEYCLVYTNGYLIFHTGNIKNNRTDIAGDHTIEVDAYSELDKENCAHFNFFINDSAAGSFYADKKKRKYEVKWFGKLSGIDSVMIQFDNDQVNESGDRNLYVKELIFDHKIHLAYQNNSEYVIDTRSGRWRFNNNYSSFAELARNRLLSLGVDSSLVLAIPGKRVRINRTLTSVIAFRDWLKESKIEVRGINIITVGTHARRTWMTYNKILEKKYNVGVISLPDYINGFSHKKKLLKTFRETVGIIYYWILLIPY